LIGAGKGEPEVHCRRVGMRDFDSCFHLPEEGGKLMIRRRCDCALRMRAQEHSATIRHDKEQWERRGVRCELLSMS
jgi:hypothetical protein